MSECDVLVVGAGPVGLINGLLLVNRGLKVIIIEKEPAIAQSPRALIYHPPTLGTLDEAGVLEDIQKAGRPASGGIRWLNASDHGLIAAMSDSALKPEDKPEDKYRTAVLLGQHKVAEIVLKKLQEKNTQILFDYAFDSLEQKDGKVYVTTTSKGNRHTFTASFIIGADGGHSPVRRAIDVHLEGYTHPFNMVAVNFRYPRMRETGFSDAQFLIDPQKNVNDSAFAVIIHTGTDEIWRCAYVDGEHFSDEELRARLPLKFKMILPGHPNEEEYEITMATPYKVHQRCVPTMVKGRVLLAGDAAHLNNPIGGFGLNTGILDAPVAARVIEAATKLTDESEVEAKLREYSDTRRKAFLEFTNPVTIANLRRSIEVSEEAEVELRGEYFEKLKGKEFQRELALATNLMALGAPGV